MAMASPMPRSNLVYCPICQVKGSAQPVLSPLAKVFVAAGKSDSKQPFAGPHFNYICQRCQYGELHEHVLDGSVTWRSGPKAAGA